MPKLRPETAKLRAAKLVKALNKHGGSESKLARELGVTQQAIHDRLQNPIVKETLQQIRDRCLAKAGITTEKVYGQLEKQLKAKKSVYIDGTTNTLEDDFNAQDKARKDALILLGHIKQDDKETNRPAEIHIHYGYRNSTVREEQEQPSEQA